MQELIAEDRGGVRILTLNRPEKRNAFNHSLTRLLLDALKAADADTKVGAIVVTGAGTSFSAGADLSEFKTLTPDNQRLVDERAALTAELHGTVPRLTKPVVTAINGPAMGGGAGLALAGDMALMAERAIIGYPEVKHGIVAAIVMPGLVRNVGRKAAFELLATAKPITAQRALALGMINDVVASADLMSKTLAVADGLAGVSRASMAATKALFQDVLDLPFSEALAAGREMNRRMRRFNVADPGKERPGV